MREIKFEHQGRPLTVRAALSGNTWKVTVLDEDNKRATPAEYIVSWEAYADSKHAIGFDDIIDELMKGARDDVIAGRVPLLP